MPWVRGQEVFRRQDGQGWQGRQDWNLPAFLGTWFMPQRTPLPSPLHVADRTHLSQPPFMATSFTDFSLIPPQVSHLSLSRLRSHRASGAIRHFSSVSSVQYNWTKFQLSMPCTTQNKHTVGTQMFAGSLHIPELQPDDRRAH